MEKKTASLTRILPGSPARLLQGIVLCCCVLLAPTGRLLAQPFCPPPISYERAVYRTETEREGAWVRDVVTETRRVAGAGPAMVQDVRITQSDSEAVSVFESSFAAESRCRPLRMTRQKKTTAGRTVVREFVCFEPTGPFPADAFPLFSLGYVLRAVCAGEAGGREILTLVPGGVLLDFQIKRGGVEDVVVPAGSKRCRKITLVPRLEALVGLDLPFLGTLMRPFVPRVHMWFDVRAPHVLVKQAYIAAVPPHDVEVIDVLTEVRHATEEGHAPPALTALPGQPGSGGPSKGPALRYTCLDPEDGSVRYAMLLRERSVRIDGEQALDLEQTWEWPDGRVSEYVDTLRTAPAPGRAVRGSRREWDARRNLYLEEVVDYEADGKAFPPEAYPYTALFTVNRNNLSTIRERGKLAYYGIFPGGVIAKLVSRYAGREEVPLATGRVECFKIRMSPDMKYFMGSIGAVVNVFTRSFMPPSTLWFSVDPPHALVRYEGLSSGERSVRSVVYQLEGPALPSDQP